MDNVTFQHNDWTGLNLPLLDDHRKDGMHRLPSIDNVKKDLWPCRRPGCPEFFLSQSDCLDHEQGYYRRFQDVPIPISPRPSLPTIGHAQQMESPSPLEEHGMNSDSISEHLASDVSRPPSTDGLELLTSTSRPLRGSGRTFRKSSTSRSPRQTINTGDMKKIKRAKNEQKKDKEKLSRWEQSAVLWRCEDLLTHLIGYCREEQSGGNGNGAGLWANKINVLRAFEALLNYFLQKGYEEALQDQRVRQWMAHMRSIVDNADHAPPFAGSFLECREEELCSHANSKSKACTTHGHPDWRECRKLLTKQRFDRALGEYLSRLCDATPRSKL